MSSNADVIRIEVGSADSKSAGSSQSYVVEFSRAKWDAMTGEQREDLLEEFRQGEIDDRFSAWATVLDEDEEG